MMEHAYKFTDTDVRRDPHGLTTTAEHYLRQYCGEFSILVDYKRRLEMGGQLTVAMVRATLNCMRYDAGSSVQLPERKAPEATGKLIDVDFVEKVKRERPLYVQVKAKRWNFEYGIHVHKLARSVHIVAPDSGWQIYTPTDDWTPQVHWLCKPVWSMRGGVYIGGSTSIELMDETSATFLATSVYGWGWCTTCQNRR